MFKELFIAMLFLACAVPASAGTGQGKGSCIYCHTNGVPAGESGSCGGCHVTPPKTGAHVTHTSGAGALYGSDANGSASAYDFNCGNCHPGNVGKHGDNTVQVELYNNAATGMKKYNPATATASGTGSSAVCSNIYCHSAGQPGTVNTYADTPQWGGSFAGNRCAGCHGYPPAYPNNTPKANSHEAHAFRCDTCHGGTTDGTGITNPALHVNGTLDVTPGAGVSFSYTYAAGGGTCSAISCHGNTGATWGGTAVCSACHGSPPPQAAAGYTAVNETTSPHMKHAGKGTNYSFACSQCHKGNTHGNGTFQDVFLDSSGILAGGSATYNGATRTCSNVYCHSIGAPAGMANQYRTVPWSGTLPGDCTGCHGGNAVSGAPIATGSHAGHVSGSSVRCASCHGATVQGTSDRVITGLSSHVDGAKTVVLSGGTYNSVTKSCSATICHQAGKAGAPQPPAPAWGGAPLGCNGCHGTGNTLGAPDYPNGGEGAVLANSHPGHVKGGASTCDTCHTGTTTTGTSIVAGSTLHTNGTINVTFNPVRAGALASFNPASKTCANISCHGNAPATWGGTGTCLACHSVQQGSRAAITSQFAGGSHHVQGTLSDDKCYQCHWEAYADGSVNSQYHGGGGAPGSPVDLVVYGAGSRPTVYSTGTGATAVQYTANGSRSEVAKLNDHCVSCHSDQNNDTTPFGDGKTPRHYAWDHTSVGSRYGQTGGTTWGKYDSDTIPGVNQKEKVVKAFSAHGNASANKRGWSAATGVDGVISDTGAASAVQCYDCHNSHGSQVAGVTSRYSSATGSKRGGILKSTLAGQGGYGIGYTPSASGSSATKDTRSAGGNLCLDCHLNQAPSATPWGYAATFGASQPVLGYWDAFGAYSTSGAEKRFPYKKVNHVKGGHFGASTPLSTSPMAGVDGLCTPCHDPHGVSPTLGANQKYAVPLLKGTWVTSPYKEDASPSKNEPFTNFAGYGEGVGYHIDQNTFGSSIRSTASGMTESLDQSSGLCLSCHPKESLTATASAGSPNPWKSKARIHESVKGWKTSDATVEHSYSCSKCHAAHTNAVLPRLMVTNCMDSRHKGRVALTLTPANAGSSGGDSGSGSGRLPGSYAGGGYYDYGPPIGYGAPGDMSVRCHDSAGANGTGAGTDQGWNAVTPWVDPNPVVTAGPFVSTGTRKVLFTMEEAAWVGSAGEVRDGSGCGNNGTAYGGATTVTGGVSGLAGNFANYSYVTFNYGSGAPQDNFAIEAWVKPSATHQIDVEGNSGVSGTGGQRYLFWPDQLGASNAGAGISVGTNGVSVYEHGDGYMPALAVYQGTISSTSWTHIAVVYSNKRPSIYVNGVLVRTGVQSQRAHVVASHTIGGGGYGYYAGLVDNVSVYDRAFSADDIAAHYRGDLSGICDSTDTTISWETLIKATSHVEYGLTSSYGSSAGSDTLVTDHSVVLPGLGTDTTYHYRVRATNEYGDESVSGDATFYRPPCTGTDYPPAATAISSVAGADNVTITWSADSGVTSLIRYGTASGVYTTTIDPAVSPQTISGLSSYQTIYYQVGTKNSHAVTWSLPYSVTAGAPPAQPTGVSAVGGDGQATVSWTPGAGSSSSAIRWGSSYYSFGPAVDPASSPYTITGLPNGQTVYYQVGAKNAMGITWGYTGYLVPVSPPTGIVGTPANGQAIISWTTGAGANSTTLRYGLTSGNYTTTLDYAYSPRTLYSLTNGQTVYFQLGSKNSYGSAWSAEYTVTPIGAPTGITAVTGDGQVTIGWTPVAGSSGSVIRYGTASGVYSTTVDPAVSPATITGLTNGQTMYYQVGAKSGAGVVWSTQGQVIPGAPATPTPVTAGYTWAGSYYYRYYSSDCVNSTTVTISWNPVTAPDGDAVQYNVSLNGALTGWQSGTSYTFPALPGSSYYWYVKARDAVHTGAESPLSTPIVYEFSTSCGSSSCPLVYSYNGADYSYQSDLQGPALSQVKKGARNVTLYQPSYLVLDNLNADGAGNYRVKIHESLQEATFLDEAKLVAVDYPAGYQVVSSSAENTYYYGYANPFTLYTIKDPVLPKAATDKNGNDVLAPLSAVDDVAAPMDASDTDNFYTLDFGAIAHPEYAKLVIDGWQDINSKLFTSSAFVQPYLEVPDANGAWVKVKSFGMPAGDLKTMVVDLSNLFISSDQRVRLHLGIKRANMWVIDRIRLDDSAPVSVDMQEIAASAADLKMEGDSVQAMPTLQHRMKVSGTPAAPDLDNFGLGNFTKYGDVTDLVSQRDDKYLVMNYADQVELTFPGPAPAQPGTVRSFLLKADLYYKDFKDYKILDPMPFHTMSDYPYPSTEAYPSDSEHQTYQEQYNTRVFTQVAAPVLTPVVSPVIGAGGGTMVEFNWSPVAAPDGDPVDYLVEVSAAEDFSVISSSSAWQPGASWLAQVPAGTWYWRVTDRDRLHPIMKLTSGTGSFSVVAQ